jgi:hypothetical protein
MYDANLAAALRALVPPLYYAWSGAVGDGLLFTRETPPPGAAPVRTTEDVAASLAARGDALPATHIMIHVFADRASAAAFDRGVTFADNALQGTVYHDPDSTLSFVALYDVEDPDVEVSVHDQRDLTSFSVEHLFQKIVVRDGDSDPYQTEIGHIVVANKDEREVLNALRSLVDRIVTTVTLNFGAGGAVTYSLPQETAG